MFSIKTIARKGPWSVEEVKYSGEDGPVNTENQNLQCEYTLSFVNPELPGIYTALRHKDRGVVMVDSPWSYETQYDILQVMHGRVLIAGLGVGHILDMIIEDEKIYQDIREIIVIEKEKDVIDLFSDKYIPASKITIVHDDVETCNPLRYGDFGVGWFDIWDTDGTEHIFSRINTLLRWSSYCDILDAWQQEKCLNDAIRKKVIQDT